MSSLILSPEDIEVMTGYVNATKQLQVLHHRGFHRAFINRAGRVVLERSHYEAVTRGESVGLGKPTKAANLTFLQRRAA